MPKNINEWSQKWGVPPQALMELAEIIMPDSKSSPKNKDLEDPNVCRLNAADKGVTLWRNNVGATKTISGSFIRFGLANVSEKMNKVIKSSDLIGISPIKITPPMVGKVIGQFIARECKRPNWNWRGTEEENAQAAFLNFVNLNGGDGRFTRGEF